MDEGNSIIYGLEYQARSLAPQIAENDAIRFVIGTQSLKPDANQIHVVELEEETGALHTKVFKQGSYETWYLRCSPEDPSLLTTCFNIYNAELGQCNMGVMLLKLPTIQVIPSDVSEILPGNKKENDKMETLRIYDTEQYGQEVKCAEFHIHEKNRLAVVVDNSVVIFDIEEGNAVNQIQLEGKGHLKFSGGKWNPHENGYQFTALQDTHLKSYDTRNPGTKPVWSLDSAHSQYLRDIDFNPNRQFYLATVGDDSYLKIWDYRHTKEPVFSRMDHSHWIWGVRYNTFHDQLLLTASSDARVLLTSAISVSSESPSTQKINFDELDDNDNNSQGSNGGTEKEINQNNSDTDITPEHGGSNKEKLSDGVLQYYEQHEDSVYCVEWSSADPWTFASLSYDGRLVISKVPRQHKYKILL